MKITEESLKQQGLDPQEATDQTPAPASEPKKSEKEKLRSMSRKDRLWYIWTYYKIPIIAVIAAVVLINSLWSAFYSTTYDTALYCIYLNSRGETEVDPLPLEQDFGAYLELGKKELITTEISYISFGEAATDYSYASMAKISALVATNSLDVIIGDTEGINHYASLSGFLNLEEQLSPEILALVSDRLYYATYEDGTSYPCAIDLSGTEFVAESHLYQTPPLLGIISNTEHKDNAEALIRYIFAS